jgi:hypothetical protein
MKVIGLMPVRNEGPLLPHSLSALSGYCDIIIVSDQGSTDNSRKACQEFPKVRLLESAENLGDKARWRLLDVAREYEGTNLLWFCDADELLSPTLWHRFFNAAADELRPGVVIYSQNHNLWGNEKQFRSDSFYRPGWTAMGLVDDRVSDYERTGGLLLHKSRVPAGPDAPTLRRADLPVLHLQDLFVEHHQIKQAWYRCREWIDQGKAAAEINKFYSVTLPSGSVPTESVPAAWIQDLTFPDFSAKLDSWQERELKRWFDEYGIEFFEPMEIWHIPALHAEFRRRTRRGPSPDRSYQPSVTERLSRVAASAFERGRAKIRNLVERR